MPTTRRFISTVFRLVLLAVCLGLWLPSEAWARPPRARERHCVIQNIEHDSRTMTLRCGKDTEPLELVWTRQAKFLKNWKFADATPLKPGQAVVIYYHSPFFVERVLLAKEPLLVLRFGVANPAAVFIAVMLLAPEPTFLAQLRVANEALVLCDFVRLAQCGFGVRLFLPGIFVLSKEGLACCERKQCERCEQHRAVLTDVFRFHVSFHCVGSFLLSLSSWPFCQTTLVTNFFPKNGIISDLKIRGSYGAVGNQGSIGLFQYQALYGGNFAANVNGGGNDNLGYPFNKIYQNMPVIKKITFRNALISIDTVYLF